MHSQLHQFTGRARRGHVVSAAARMSCALGLVLAACGDGSAASSGHQGLGDNRQFEGDPAENGAQAGDKAPVAAPANFDECVQRAVSERGSVEAVTALACPGAASSACDVALDLTVLAGFKNLTALDLSNRCVSDLRPLTVLGKLEQLALAGNRVEDVTPLAALTGLRSLDLSGNPVKATWGYTRTEPFSRLTQLEVLKLDDVPLNNILPLGSLASLRVLHLRRGQLPSLRPLRTLTNLRELHVDQNEFEELSPLEDLLQLEQLTASQNYISSLDPVRHLVERGSLRSASLDRNCVSACEQIKGANISCTEPESGCGGMEDANASMGDLSVPLRFVERDAPSAGLPIWSEEEVQRAFDLISERIKWSDPTSDCEGRATESAAVLEAAGFPAMTKVWAFGNIRALAPNASWKYVWFDWHVAPAMRTARGFVVLDAAFAPSPVSLRAWFERLVDTRGVDRDSEGNPIDYSCRAYWKDRGNLDQLCGEAGVVPVDAAGDLLVSDVEDLRGTICKSSACGTPF